MPELQVTWLYVRIPPNASLKEFVMAFGEALDLAVFGPGRDVYQEEMRRQSGNVISMLAAFRKRARQHHVGLLIVDELQFLSIGRAQGKRELSKFLHELVDRTGIPLLFSGTYKAYDMLLETVHETARVVGLGKIDFAPWARDAREWKLFVKTLWKYQWLQQAEPYTEDLAALMHDLVQGVMAFAVTLFVVAQWRAMATGKEKVTPDLLRSVMQNELSLLNGPIDKLREGTVESLMAYEDLLPAARKMQEILTNASQHIFAGRLQDIVRDELNKVAPNYDPTSSSVGAGAGTAKTGNAAEAQTADARSVPPASPDDLRHALDADNPLEVLEKFGVLDGEDAAVTGKIAA